RSSPALLFSRAGEASVDCKRELYAVASEPLLDVPGEVTRVAALKLGRAPVTAGDHTPAFSSPAGTLHTLSGIAIDHCVIDGEFGTRGDVVHRHEGDLAANADVRVAGVVQAEYVGFDFGCRARRDGEIVLDLDLGGRDFIADALESRAVHYGAALDRNDFSC